MLLFIAMLGGLLLMMGHHARSESLFYYFRLEDQVPENHLLRLIDKHVSFDFGAGAIEGELQRHGPIFHLSELLLRILLIGYLYGVTSERKLVEELRMHLAWRWFTGLSFDEEIPHHSTFSKNRHGRFQESKLFEQLFEQIVQQCVEVGLVRGDNLSVDGSFVEANAAKESRIPREQLMEAAEVHYTLRQYLQEVEQQNPVEEPVNKQEQVSTTDPDSTYATKGGTPARLGILRQLSRGQSQLRGRGCTSDGGPHESGDGGRTGHDHPLCPATRRKASLHSSRYDLWQWGVSGLVAGSRHYPLYAHARQCSAKEQSRLWPGAIYLSAGEQQLPLSCGRATELRWLERSQSCPCLYRQRETLRSLLAKSAVHEWTI